MLKSKKKAKSKSGETFDVKFVLKEPKKGAIRYQEVNDDGDFLTTNDPECFIGALYLRKEAFDINDDTAPEEITVTITL